MSGNSYIIQHRVLDPAGQKLVVTFSKSGEAPILTPLADSGPTAAQLWIVEPATGDKKSVIKAKNDASLQAAASTKYDEVVITLNGGYVYFVKKNAAGAISIHTTSPMGDTLAWQVARVIENQKVVLADASGVSGLLQDWIVIKN